MSKDSELRASQNPRVSQAETSSPALPEESSPTVIKAPRRGRKRTVFHRIPKMPVPVRALWESASEEQRTLAHRTCSALLEAWLGKSSREEVAARLGVSRLRLWQLSQQATAGMLAGLLKQPRRRPGMVKQSLPPDEDPVKLKRRIEALEKDLLLADDVIKLLRELPGNKDRVLPRETRRKPPKRKAKAVPVKRRKSDRRRPSGEKKGSPHVLRGESGARDRRRACRLRV